MTETETVVRAGVWLIRNGYGGLALLPYASPSGTAWRCEFHPAGRPSQIFYRYSTASGRAYLENHCGGVIDASVSPEGLAKAIMVSVPSAAKAQCTGRPTGAMQRWLSLLEESLTLGFVPQAFHEYSDDLSRWDLARQDASGWRTIRPQPGYLAPGTGNPPDEPTNQTWPISRTPAKDEAVRKATRVLAMVHELHKAGYQYLRVCVGASADKRAWRCHLVPAAGVAADGWTPRGGGPALQYSTTDGAAYFGWDDCAREDARGLAAKLLTRAPDLAAASSGQDWAYAGWFASVLGAAEQGYLPALYGGLDFKPEPGRISLPPPLPEHCNSEEPVAADGDELLDDGELELCHLPAPYAHYEDLCEFCLTHDGYRGGLRDLDDCAHIAKEVFRNGLPRASIASLRTAAFFHQRKLKWQDWEPIKEEDLAPIHAIVEELRRRLS